MSKSNHPIEQEELMAYLDGELATSRAVAAAAHLEHCAECQELAADLRNLSQELMAWEVEQCKPEEIPAAISMALEKKGTVNKLADRWSWRTLLTPRRLAWSGGIAVFVLLVMAVSIPNLLRSRFAADTAAQMSRTRAETAAGNVEDGYVGGKGDQTRSGDTVTAQLISPNQTPTPPSGTVSSYSLDKLTRNSESEGDETDTSERTVPAVPMIARVAGITLSTKEFDKTRASLEEILKRHNGYMGELKVSAPADAGRKLAATLRVPGPQLEAAMAELKKLGRVEDESQGGEEVTQQYVDLQARLANGKHTEQRLTEILRTRTGKLQDVLKVELEIDRVRGEIEQMQAEQKELTKRVAFATLNATIKEEYQAKLQATPPSTGSRFRNAAVDGYNTVIEGLIDVALFLLSAGPSLLLWAAILFFPARWAWKKLRRRIAEPDVPSAP